ncbi:transporter substrate-binding domain-containing protein [Aeromonas sanarellii]|uniref:histidine kinase n=1 Tax=Aeromonas sanarellii TaxID=633415 RepID=A0ABS4B8W8_9GAMM|nr:transporter substrate-binding domain-containing protein [Aeromonas sanarellii]MBP0603917.1 transporter substrate-binding domain-containing protein [Aeromonas sanarellii]
MFCRCCRLILLCWLTCWSLVATAHSSQLDASAFTPTEQAWLATHHELVIGMPATAWPPYVYTDGRGNFTGPLNEFASQIAGRLGLGVRYRAYANNAGLQQALMDGEVDMLIGVAPSPTRTLRMRFTSELMALPRAILLTGGRESLSLEEAYGVRWVCVFGVSACDELQRLGISNLVTVDSRDEAVFLLKEGKADAYLAELPMLSRLQVMAGMTLVTVDWMRDTSLAMAVAPEGDVLQGLLERALDDISALERRSILEAGGILDYALVKGNREIVFSPQEQAWLQAHPVIRYGVAPNWPGMSEIDERGRLKGFIAELLAMMSQRAGLQFTLVPTESWTQSLALFQARKLDLIPAMTPTAERQQFARFTPNYASLNRVVVARKGMEELTSPKDLKGHPVGMVGGSVEKMLLTEVGAVSVPVASDPELLPLLDRQQVDYVLMGMTTLEQSLKKGFSDRYQVVYSGNDLRVPVAMATQRQDPMLQQILTKVLLAIPPEELTALEKKWLSLTIQTGLDPQKVLLWSSLGGGLFLLSLLLFLGWNRTLRRQVSQRREVERRLEEQLAFVQMMLDALPNLVVLTNEHYEVAMTNRAYRQMFLGGENLMGSYERLLKDRLPEAIRARVVEEDARVWESGEEFHGRGELLRDDGSLHQMIYTKRLFVGPDGKRLGILTVLTDVTELEQARFAAQEAQTRLTQITDSMPGLVYQYHWLGPGNGRFLYTSQGLKEMVGYDMDPVGEEVTGAAILGLTGQAHREFVATVERHARAMEPLDLEVEIQRQGQSGYLQIRGHFVHQEGLEGVVLNGVVQDITKLKRQELELRQARRVAEEATQARSRFLATMSHELRTPISGMHGMLELLQMSALDDDQRYMLRNISTSTNHLLYLVNDILDFSKMEAGQLQLHPHRCRLTSVICDVIRGHAAHAYGKGLNVTLAWGREVPDQASIDGVRVGQVISNLLSNAVKFTEAGGVAIQVAYQDHRLTLRVRDTGIGIAGEKQDNLFIPFRQVESDINRRFGGTGLGLAICHQLTQKMGGSLTLESEPGVGTTVTFAIPLVDCQWDAPPLAEQAWWWFGEDEALPAMMERFGARLHRLTASQWQQPLEGYLLAQERTLEQALGSDWLAHLQRSSLKGIVLSHHEALRGRMGSDAWWRLGQSPLYPDLLLETCHQLSSQRPSEAARVQGEALRGRVLVADDHPVNRALLTRQLAILGLESEVVEDGVQALLAWQGQGFALLLTDCHMPVMDGYALARSLREAGDQTPIIGVTADTSEEASQQMREAGMNDMLFKPYSLDALRQILVRWLPAREPRPMASRQARVQVPGISWLTLFGDEEVARSMAAEYLEANEQDSEDMRQALARQDSQALVETAHRIKGAARMVGQQALAEEAARLEAAARLKQWDRLDELALAVQALMNGIRGETGLWLDE